jgi:uncharacterized membrane protein YhaH (DUF805 family)
MEEREPAAATRVKIPRAASLAPTIDQSVGPPLRKALPMSFQDAVRICLAQKYADFSGRARRSEYWWFFLFTALIAAVASVIDSILGTRNSTGTGLVQAIVQLAVLIPSLAVGVRRLHDTGRSGWWLLIGLVPVAGWVVLLIFFVQASHGENQYGPSPKAYDGAEPPVAP